MEKEVKKLLKSEGMLSFKQWRDKHSSKLANVNNKEIRRRYDQYLMSSIQDPGRVMRDAYKAGKHDNNPIGQLPGRSMGSLSKCSRDFATALVDPWSITSPPCVPDLITLPSFKFGARARGTMQVGLGGAGFVAVNINAVSNSTGVPVTSIAGLKTTSTFDQTVYVQGGDGTEIFTNDSPLTSNAVGSLVTSFSWRLVGCGLKLRYVGSEMFRGGRIIAYRNPSNLSIGGNTSPEQMLNNRETRISPTERKWHYVAYKPALANDLSYKQSQPGTTQQMIIFVDGATPGQAFEYDVIWWFECTGGLLPQLTPSHNDVLGYSATLNAIPSIQPKGTPEAELHGFFDTIQSTANEVMSFISPIAKTILPFAEAMLL